MNVISRSGPFVHCSARPRCERAGPGNVRRTGYFDETANLIVMKVSVLPDLAFYYTDNDGTGPLISPMTSCTLHMTSCRSSAADALQQVAGIFNMCSCLSPEGTLLPSDDNDDSDEDGVEDSADNCPSTANAEQTDTDSDGQGDACDSDDDNDGIADAVDTCPLDATNDVDNDGVCDAGDICLCTSVACFGGDPLVVDHLDYTASRDVSRWTAAGSQVKIKHNQDAVRVQKGAMELTVDGGGIIDACELSVTMEVAGTGLGNDGTCQLTFAVGSGGDGDGVFKTISLGKRELGGQLNFVAVSAQVRDDATLLGSSSSADGGGGGGDLKITVAPENASNGGKCYVRTLSVTTQSPRDGVVVDMRSSSSSSLSQGGSPKSDAPPTATIIVGGAVAGVVVVAVVVVVVAVVLAQRRRRAKVVAVTTTEDAAAAAGGGRSEVGGVGVNVICLWGCLWGCGLWVLCEPTSTPCG